MPTVMAPLQQDWRVRQQAVEALGTLAAAIQVSQLI